MMNLKRIKMNMRRAIEAKLEAGYDLQTGLRCVAEEECFCAVGSLMLLSSGQRYSMEDASESTGVDINILGAIRYGFEGNGYDIHNFNHDAWSLGRQLRCDYYETTDEVVS